MSEYIKGSIFWIYSFRFKSFRSNSRTNSKYLLIVGGGDVEQADRIKQSLSLLNLNRNDETIKLFLSADVLYLYENFLFRTTILQLITKNIDDDEEEAAG